MKASAADRKTLAQHFDYYVASVYDNQPLNAEQLREIRNAFFAGVCLAYTEPADYSIEVKSFFETLMAGLDSGGSRGADQALETWMHAGRHPRGRQ